jgi:hypothetical protein
LRPGPAPLLLRSQLPLPLQALSITQLLLLLAPLLLLLLHWVEMRVPPLDSWDK